MGQILYNRDSLPKVRPTDFDVFECYLEEGRRAVWACNLLTFAWQVFKRAEVIKKLDLIIAIQQSGEAKDQQKAMAKLSDVLLDSLMDNIRISVCFENYFKAKLLLSDLVIHSVSKDKNKVLAGEQFGRPIEVKEIISTRTAQDLLVLKDLLRVQTINYSTILDLRAYNKLLSIPDDILQFLQQKNVRRNELHLHINERFDISDHILKQYKELVSIVDVDLAMLQNTLLDKYDSGSPSRLPIKLP